MHWGAGPAPEPSNGLFEKGNYFQRGLPQPRIFSHLVVLAAFFGPSLRDGVPENTRKSFQFAKTKGLFTKPCGLGSSLGER